MKTIFRLLCVSVFLCSVIAAQTSDIPNATTLVAGTWNPVQGLNGQTSGFPRCDARGNVYIAVEAPGSWVNRPTLYRVSPDGHIQATFSQPSGIGGKTGYGRQAFAQNGTVAMLDVAGDAEYILWFGPHGEYAWRRPMQWRSQSGLIGLFPAANAVDAKVLLTYQNRGRGGNGHGHDMHTGVYDLNGNLIAEVKLPDDDDIKRAVDNGDSRFVLPSAKDSNMAVDLGELASGTDGNVYVLRGHTNPAIVYAIDSTGTLVLSTTIEAPFPTMWATNLQADKGEIVVQFYDPATSKRVVSVNDWNTGARLRLYDLTGVVGYYACFNPETERLTFLSANDDHQIGIRFAFPAKTTAQSKP